MKSKLTVITDSHGAVIATQVGHGEPDPKTGIAFGILAGPGQTIHKMEFDVPSFRSRRDVDDFHLRVSEFLRR